MTETTIVVNSDDNAPNETTEIEIEAVETVVDASVEIAQIEADTLVELAEIEADKEITIAAIEADNNPQESDNELCRNIHHLTQTVENLSSQVLNLETQLASLRAIPTETTLADLTPQSIFPETSETQMEALDESESESLIPPLVEVKKRKTFLLV